MRVSLAGLFAVFCVFIAGCASINYNEIAPNAGSFHPKTVVVLPVVKMPEGMDQDGDKLAAAISSAATNTKRFARVVEATAARSVLANNSALQDAVMNYVTKLRTINVSDKELSRKIGEVYGADTIIVGEAGKWGYVKYADEKAGEAGVALKMIDAATGTVYWKAAHADKKTYTLFKPNLADMAAGICERIFGFMPKP